MSATQLADLRKNRLSESISQELSEKGGTLEFSSILIEPKLSWLFSLAYSAYFLSSTSSLLEEVDESKCIENTGNFILRNDVIVLFCCFDQQSE